MHFAAISSIALTIRFKIPGKNVLNPMYFKHNLLWDSLCWKIFHSKIWIFLKRDFLKLKAHLSTYLYTFNTWFFSWCKIRWILHKENFDNLFTEKLVSFWTLCTFSLYQRFVNIESMLCLIPRIHNFWMAQ